MSSPPTIPTLRGTISVAVPADRAFRIFTDPFNSWWPAHYHIGQAEMAEAVLEPGKADAGTSAASTAANATGAACWVRFTPDGPDQTTVELEHRHLDRLVDGQALHDGITGAAAGSPSWTCSPRRYPTSRSPARALSTRDERRVCPEGWAVGPACPRRCW